MDHDAPRARADQADDTFPRISLNAETVRENIIAWRKFTQRPVWPVVKSDGYGWGLPAMTRICEREADGFCVVDFAEFELLRACTEKPVIVLGALSPEEAVAVAQRRGHPNIVSLGALRAVESAARASGRRLPVRLGIAPACGWFGIARDAVDEYARNAASEFLAVEVWTHLLDRTSDETALAEFSKLCRHFEAAGVVISLRDVVNSRAAADGVAAGERVRLGSGLFGAHARTVPGVRNALRVQARRIESSVAGAETIAGYRRTQIQAGAPVDVVRIGYGDGLPRGLAGATINARNCASIGMQFTVLYSAGRTFSDTTRAGARQNPLVDAPANPAANLTDTHIHANSASPTLSENWLDLFSENDDLAEIAAAGNSAAHEIICGLGNLARLRLQTP